MYFQRSKYQRKVVMPFYTGRIERYWGGGSFFFTRVECLQQALCHIDIHLVKLSFFHTIIEVHDNVLWD